MDLAQLRKMTIVQSKIMTTNEGFNAQNTMLGGISSH